MPTVSDVLSISQGIYAPAIFTIILLFISGSFLDSTRIVKDLVGKVEGLVLTQGSEKHNLTRLVVFILLFFLAPMVYNIIGALSPISLSYSPSSDSLFPDDRRRLAQMWCSFPSLVDRSMLEAFVYSMASDHAGDPVNLLFNERTNASGTYFRHATTAAILLLLSFVAFIFSRKYRKFRAVNLVLSVAAIAAIGIQSAAEQRHSYRAVARDITVSAHSRLLAEGRIASPSDDCIVAREAEIASRPSVPAMAVRWRIPRVYSIIPVDPPRKRD